MRAQLQPLLPSRSSSSQSARWPLLYTRPLTALEPPSVFPRTHASTRPLGPNGTVGKCHAYLGLPSSLPKPLGMRTIMLLSSPPASSNSTLVRPSSLSRLASTQPADPAPTTT